MLSEQDIKEIARRVIEQHLQFRQDAAALAPVKSPAPPPPDRGASRSLALGADHGGYELKEKLKPLLYELGWAVDDCGTYSEAPVDYPTVALAVALKVSQGKVSRGIMIDGAGIGSCMTANKVPGIRAALCYDTLTAKNSREHNDANVLTLGGRLVGLVLAQEIVKTWLSTECREERHRKRVALITEIEKRYSGASSPA